MITSICRSLVVAVMMSASVFAGAPALQAAQMSGADVAEALRSVFHNSASQRGGPLNKLVQRGNKDVAASLILTMRYRRDTHAVARALSRLTGTQIKGWEDGMLWQEAHPEVKPHPSFHDLKLEIFSEIDPQFLRFLGGDKSKPENMKIRLEEITWGGVRVDGIPSLDNPKLISAGEASYLKGDDLVFGIEINGDVRAYPLRIMGWHEMFNETIGGVPVALAYCTLCGAGILFETQIEGRDKPLVFGSSGFLYRSNKLMFDRETDSLWNQFTGKPVSGPLLDSGIELTIRPVTITSWSEWSTAHPKTKVLSLDTGHRRDYGSGVVYARYFSSPDLMFPTIVRNEDKVLRKDFVFGIRDVGAAKAWPLTAFATRNVINDKVGSRNVVLIGDAKTRTVRAYERGGREFSAARNAGLLKGPGGDWKVTEDALIGPNGDSLARQPGHVSYWFAWDGYLGVKSELYSEPR